MAKDDDEDANYPPEVDDPVATLRRGGGQPAGVCQVLFYGILSAVPLIIGRASTDSAEWADRERARFETLAKARDAGPR